MGIERRLGVRRIKRTHRVGDDQILVIYHADGIDPSSEVIPFSDYQERMEKSGPGTPHPLGTGEDMSEPVGAGALALVVIGIATVLAAICFLGLLAVR